MRTMWIFFFLPLLASCNETNKVNHHDLLHAGSAKIWLAVEHEVNGQDQISLKREETIFLTMFDDGYCTSGLMSGFDSHEYVVNGNYTFSEEANALTITWNEQEPLLYKVTELNTKKLVLESEDASTRLVFIPYFNPPASAAGGLIEIQ